MMDMTDNEASILYSKVSSIKGNEIEETAKCVGGDRRSRDSEVKLLQIQDKCE
jgi:hypothetical protein